MAKQHELLTALFANIKARKLAASKTAGLQPKIDALLGFMRAHQRRLEADTASHVAVLSARQQGKSTGVLLLAVIRCLQKARAQWVIIGLTRNSVQRIYWDVLHELDEAFELGLKFQEQRLIVTFPSGSRIHFFGADKLDEIEKLRGSRFHGAIVDECKSYPELTLKHLLEDVLGACLKGQAGQLYIIGTPGDVLSGEFFLATTEDPVFLEKQKRWSNLPYGEASRLYADTARRGIWSLHHWGPKTNDVQFRNERTGQTFTMWDAFLEEKELRGWADDHPTWRREYLGHWVPGDGRLVYRYRPHLHDYEPAGDQANPWGLPTETTGWRTACGIDFGTKDGTSVVVWAWHPNVMGLWELYSEKRKPEDWGVEGGLTMSVRLIAEWLKAVEADYGPFDGIVGDPAGLATMVIDTLAAEHSVYVEPAEKKEKLDHIELFNNDLDAGLIHFRRGGELGEEMLGNKWLEKTLGTPKRKEDPGTPNDLCDAALYAFRWCAHRQARPKPPMAPLLLTAEWYRQLAAREREETLKKLTRPKDDFERLDSEWWSN